MSEIQTTAAASDVALLDGLSREAQELAVTRMLDQSRQWLERALEATNPAQDVADFKAFVATVAEAARQKKLSESIQLDAVEMVRRSERALGLAVRKGQESGEIGAPIGRPSSKVVRDSSDFVSPKDFLTNGSDVSMTYAVTDDVTDEQFDQALAEAKEEGNLSRANVVRKVANLKSYREEQDEKWERVADLANSGVTSHQIAVDVGMSREGLIRGAARYNITFPADQYVARTRRINPLDVLERIVLGIEEDRNALALVSYEDVTPEQAEGWLERLTEPLRAIRKMQAELKEIANA